MSRRQLLNYVGLRLALAAALTVITACSNSGTSATVKLKIAGHGFDYKTSHAEVDQQIPGGPWSVYLMPDGDANARPWLGIRTYSGNAIARLFLRYRKPGDKGDAARRWECFVPGQLADGRATLTWKKGDGGERIRQETGDADCTATVAQQGNELVMRFDATVRPRVEKKKKGSKKSAQETAGDPKERVRIVGEARITLP